jgi:hypothetical protein
VEQDMPKLLWALICQRVITDQITNSVSYIDVIEEFAVPEAPFPFPPFVVSSLWERESANDSMHVRIRIVGPDGQVVTSFNTEEPVLFPNLRHRINVTLGGGRVTKSGKHSVLIENKRGTKWQKAWEVPVHVRVASEQPS